MLLAQQHLPLGVGDSFAKHRVGDVIVSCEENQVFDNLRAAKRNGNWRTRVVNRNCGRITLDDLAKAVA